MCGGSTNAFIFPDNGHCCVEGPGLYSVYTSVWTRRAIHAVLYYVQVPSRGPAASPAGWGVRRTTEIVLLDLFVVLHVFVGEPLARLDKVPDNLVALHELRHTPARALGLALREVALPVVQRDALLAACLADCRQKAVQPVVLELGELEPLLRHALRGHAVVVYEKRHHLYWLFLSLFLLPFAPTAAVPSLLLYCIFTTSRSLQSCLVKNSASRPVGTPGVPPWPRACALCGNWPSKTYWRALAADSACIEAPFEPLSSTICPPITPATSTDTPPPALYREPLLLSHFCTFRIHRKREA